MHAEHFYALAFALLAGSALAGEAGLTCTAPTQDEDGSPLTDLAGYRFYSGCGVAGTYDRPRVDVGPATCGARITGLPDTGVCFFVATAVDVDRNESQPSNVALKVMSGGPPPVLVVPGPVRNLVVTPVATPPPTSGTITLNLVMWGASLQFTMTVEGSPFQTLSLTLLGGAQFDELRWPAGTVPNLGINNDSLRAATVSLNRMALPANIGGDIEGTLISVDGRPVNLTGLQVTINGVTQPLNALYPPGGFPQGFGGRVNF